MLHTTLYSISELSNEVQRYLTFLSPQEIEKSQRIINEEKAIDYVTCRGKLREELSHYLKIDPDKINFSHNKYGKPYIADSSLYFNCSHSRDALAICISRNIDLGIDIESINLTRNVGRLIAKVFSPEETLFYNELKTSDEKSLYFYKVWTIKEAITKEQGTGIIASLNSISPRFISDSLYISDELYIHHKYINEYSLALASKDQRPNPEFEKLIFQ
jgi:4'-phosphopantetheinyl transferase